MNKHSLNPLRKLSTVVFLAVTVLLAMIPSTLRAAAFTAGDVVVERMEGIGSGGTAASLVEYNSAGTLQQTISLPNAATRPTANPYNLMDSGSAGSNDSLQRWNGDCDTWLQRYFYGYYDC